MITQLEILRNLRNFSPLSKKCLKPGPSFAHNCNSFFDVHWLKLYVYTCICLVPEMPQICFCFHICFRIWMVTEGPSVTIHVGRNKIFDGYRRSSVTIQISLMVTVTIQISIIHGQWLQKTFCNHSNSETDAETETDLRLIFTDVYASKFGINLVRFGVSFPEETFVQKVYAYPSYFYMFIISFSNTLCSHLFLTSDRFIYLKMSSSILFGLLVPADSQDIDNWFQLLYSVEEQSPSFI